MTNLKALLVLVFLIATSSPATSSDFRLSDQVKPIFQDIQLTLDPGKPRFSGKTVIDIVVSKPQDSIGFYQSELTIDAATLVKESTRHTLTITPAKHDIHFAAASQRIEPGAYSLEFSFTGKLNNTSDGLYISKFEERNYISTQFEDMLARKAFPSFDEPDNKIPYQVTITAPEKYVVLSNTPMQKRSTIEGMQTVVFKKTKPMPSYLLAMAVGEFDSIELKGLAVPGRIYAPKGHAHKAGFAAQQTPKILAYLESYFGRPYPYEKLDFVAVPNFTHGAMENVGLVTFRSGVLLRGDKPALTEQAGPLMLIAHELAHMWYGNLVTMTWWDDLWLNEAFASHMASKVMLDLYPEHNYASRIVSENAFEEDAAVTTRPVKKTVRVSSDVMDGLGLNYSKGEAILKWVESQVGARQFQKAIRTYMNDFAWRNASADDLWKAIAKSSKVDVPSMMRTYLEQASYPLVTLTEGGTLTQKRYTFAGAQAAQQEWVVPINLKFKKDGKVHVKSIMLAEESQKFPELAGADWVYLNTDARGYYRWRIPVLQTAALMQDASNLNTREKKSLLSNQEALLKAGEIGLVEMMTMISHLAQDDDLQVAKSVTSTLAEFEYLVNEKNQKHFGLFLDELFMAWFTKLGVVDRPSDSDETNRLRHAIFDLLGAHSSNARVRETVIALADQYLSNPSPDKRQMAYRALRSVAKHGGEDWFKKFVKAHRNTSDSNVQTVIEYSMMFKHDQELIAALDFALSENVSPANTIAVASVAATAQDKQDTFYAWMADNFEKLTARLPDHHIAQLPIYVSKSCDQHNIKLAERFYKDRASMYQGMQRAFDIAISDSRQCLALKQRYQEAFSNYVALAQKNGP